MQCLHNSISPSIETFTCSLAIEAYLEVTRTDDSRHMKIEIELEFLQALNILENSLQH
jgi:hypothetical protein